jgi:hypothetical protein
MLFPSVYPASRISDDFFCLGLLGLKKHWIADPRFGSASLKISRISNCPGSYVMKSLTPSFLVFKYERLFFFLCRDRRLEARTLGCTSTSRQAKDPQPGQHKNWTRPWNRPSRLRDDSCKDNLHFTFCVPSCRWLWRITSEPVKRYC